MSEVTHEYPRAYKAATEVDPLILASALDHIAKTASKSRSQTRRTRWIEQRALTALRGAEYRDIDVDLPKDPGPGAPERLQRRMAYHIATKHEVLEVLKELVFWVKHEVPNVGDVTEVLRADAVIAKFAGEQP